MGRNRSILFANILYSLRCLVSLIHGLLARLSPEWFVLLALRIALAVPFWRSGVNKWDGFLALKPSTVFLFGSQFKLHLPGGPYAYPAPGAIAFAAGVMEIVLPALLVAGFATRLSAFGLFIMTGVIQLTVPTGWPVHLSWAAMALALVSYGPGRLSLDHVLGGLHGNSRMRSGAEGVTMNAPYRTFGRRGD